MKQLSEVLHWIPAFAGMTRMKRVPVWKTLFLLGQEEHTKIQEGVKKEGSELAAQIQANFEELGI